MAKSWLACEACRQLHVHVVLDTAAPVVSFVAETNAIVTAGWSVTVSGVDFGYADTTPTNELGLSSCPTVAWVSSSSLACYLARGESPLAEALATVSTVVGTQTSVFSYDGRQADQGWHAFGIAFAFLVGIIRSQLRFVMVTLASCSARGQLRRREQRGHDDQLERDCVGDRFRVARHHADHAPWRVELHDGLVGVVDVGDVLHGARRGRGEGRGDDGRRRGRHAHEDVQLRRC